MGEGAEQVHCMPRTNRWSHLQAGSFSSDLAMPRESASCCGNPASTSYEVIATSSESGAEPFGFAHHLYMFGDTSSSSFHPSSMHGEPFDRFQAIHYCSDLSALQAALRQVSASSPSSSPEGRKATATIVLSVPVGSASHGTSEKDAGGAGAADDGHKEEEAAAHGTSEEDAGGAGAHGPQEEKEVAAVTSAAAASGGAVSEHGLKAEAAAAHGSAWTSSLEATSESASSVVCRSVAAVRHAAGPSTFIVLWHPDAVEDPFLRIAAFEGGANMVGAG